MSKELCDRIIDYISNRCPSTEVLTDTGKELETCRKYNLITDDEFRQIVEAGRKRRQQFDSAKEFDDNGK